MRGFADLAACHDLKLDVPDAIETISTFIARGVVDDILPPKFAEVTLAGDPTCQGPDAQTVASKASEQISQRFSTDRVLHAWGHFDKTPYEQAKTELEMLLKEYLESHDVTEARRRLHDLAKPFFHHELVKKALVMMIESDKDSNALGDSVGFIARLKQFRRSVRGTNDQRFYESWKLNRGLVFRRSERERTIRRD